MKIPEISNEIFGGILVSDGAGHYPGLELFNYLYREESGKILIAGNAPRFIRTSQDFARRLVWDYERFSLDDDGKDVFVGEETEHVLRHLLECLQLRVPNRKTRNWEAAHFFPYTRSLIHWDARRGRRQREAMIERRYYRGGGAMIHKVLRTDPDKERLESIREGFTDLLPENNKTALERIASVMNRHSVSRGAKPDEEEQNVPDKEEDKLNDLYRDGVKNILSHSDLSSTARIKAIVNWSGFWLAISQMRRAAAYLDEIRPNIVVDFGKGASQIRRESNRNLKDILSMIVRSSSRCAEVNSAPPPPPKGQKSLSGFFTITSSWIGLLNAFSGKRHFVIGLDLLETLVMSCTRPGLELPFEDFICEVLYEKYGLIVGREAASIAGLHNRMDASIFEDNENLFADQLLASGLMHDFSDATRMVSTRALK